MSTQMLDEQYLNRCNYLDPHDEYNTSSTSLLHRDVVNTLVMLLNRIEFGFARPTSFTLSLFHHNIMIIIA